MIKKHIRILFALGIAFINLTILDVNAYWHETHEERDEVNYYLQVEKRGQLKSFDYFYCDKNPNVTLTDFHGETSHSVTPVESLSLPGSPNHVVHQFGKKLLIIPGTTYQDRHVCYAGTEQGGFLQTVLMPDFGGDKPEGLFARIRRYLTLYRPDELEEVLKQQFWWELVDFTDEMIAPAEAVSKEEVDTRTPDGSGWKGFFPGGGGRGGNDEGDDSGDDGLFPGLGGLLGIPLVSSKPGGAFIEDFGGFWLPKFSEKKRAKKTKKINMVVVPSGDSSDSSSTIEITENPVIENLTIVQFALMIGGFEVDDDLQEQLLNLDQLSSAELEQLANGFSTTITNLDSLISQDAIQTPGLSNEQLIKILMKIEALVRELMTIRESLSDPDISRDLWRVRGNLRMLVGSRLASTVLGSNEVTVSGDASQHEMLVRVLLEEDNHAPAETEEPGIEEIQDLIDEYIRRIQSGLTGEDLIRALVKKIEAIQRQIDRREANLGSVNGSWFRALKNRLESLNLELSATQQTLGRVIHSFFEMQELYQDGVSKETDNLLELHIEPEDHGGGQKIAGNGAGASSSKKNPNQATGGGGKKEPGDLPPPNHQPPPSGERGNGRDGGDDRRDGGDLPKDESNGDGVLSEAEQMVQIREMSAWFAERLRMYSSQDARLLPEYATGLQEIIEESLADNRQVQIQIHIRELFEQSYPQYLWYLPPENDVSAAEEREKVALFQSRFRENQKDQYVPPDDLLLAELVPMPALARSLHAVMIVMRPIALARYLTQELSLEEMHRIRVVFNHEVGGKSLSRDSTLTRRDGRADVTPVSFRRNQSEEFWYVEALHNGDELLTTREAQEDFQKRLQQLSIHQVIAGDEDGIIRFDEAETLRLQGGARDSIRMPIRVEYVRLRAPRHSDPEAVRGEAAVSDRRFPVYDSKEVEEIMIQRFRASEDEDLVAAVTGDSNGYTGQQIDYTEEEQAGSGAVDTSVRGNVQDVLQLLFKDQPEVETLFNFLLSQNTGNMPRTLFFGGVNEDQEEVAGQLKSLGLGDLNPSNTLQSEGRSQDVTVKVYSTGQIFFHYRVTYDRAVMRHNLGGSPKQYDANFSIDLELEFETEGGLRNTYSEIRYNGDIDKSVRSQYRKDLRAIRSALKKDSIHRLKEANGRIHDALNRYKQLRYFPEKDMEWRNAYEINELRSALHEYQEMLRILHAERLDTKKDFVKARRGMDDNDTIEELRRQIQAFQQLERVTYEALKPAPKIMEEAGSWVSEAYEDHEGFREKVLSELDKIDQLRNRYSSKINHSNAELVNLRNDVTALIVRAEKLDFEYNQHGGKYYKQRKAVRAELNALKKAPGLNKADQAVLEQQSEWFDLFKIDTVIQRAVLFEARLLMEKVRQQEGVRKSEFSILKKNLITPAPTYEPEINQTPVSRPIARSRSKSVSNVSDRSLEAGSSRTPSPGVGKRFSSEPSSAGSHSRQTSRTEMTVWSPLPKRIGAETTLRQRSWSENRASTETLRVPVLREYNRQRSLDGNLLPVTPLSPVSRRNFGSPAASVVGLRPPTQAHGEAAFMSLDPQVEQFQAMVGESGQIPNQLIRVISNLMIQQKIRPSDLADLLSSRDMIIRFDGSNDDAAYLDEIRTLLERFMAVSNKIRNLVKTLRIIFGTDFDTTLGAEYRIFRRNDGYREGDFL